MREAVAGSKSEHSVRMRRMESRPVGKPSRPSESGASPGGRKISPSPVAVLLLTLSTAPVAPSWTPSIVDVAPTHGSSLGGEDLQQRVTMIDESLTKLNTNFRALFGDSLFRIGVHYFSEAQSAATKLLHDGRPVPAEVSRLHNNIDELIRGLSDLEKSARATLPAQASGRQSPAPKLAKPLRECLASLKDVANEQEGLKDIGRVKLKDSTSAADAVEYGGLLLDRMQMVLYNRGVEQITDAEKRETDTRLGPPLSALRSCISGMIDSSGARVVQVDEKGERRADQLFLVRQALSDADKSLDLFKTAFPKLRERIALVQSDLGVLRENFVKPRALHE